MLIAENLKQISGVLNELCQGDLCLVDVDDTLITPCASICQGNQNFIQELKTKRDQFPAFENLLGNWRLQRKTRLVEDAWPVQLQKLLNQHVTVAALTKIETSTFGPIDSMEDWREHELSTFGLRFTTPIAGQDSFKVLESDQGYSCFNKGILCTGPFTKSEVLKAFLPYLPSSPQKIVVIDDRQEQLTELNQFAEERRLPFCGIFYRAVELKRKIPDPTVVDFQKNHFLQTHQWLEEEEATRRLAEL